MQVADGEPDDRGLVQLAGDGPRQRQHLGQLEELKVLLPPTRARCIARLLFAQVLETGGVRGEGRARRWSETTSGVRLRGGVKDILEDWQCVRSEAG